MRIVHFSDIHFGTHIPRLVDALVERTNALNPDGVIASGDFTMAGRHWEFREAAAMLRRIDAPVVATPGNHDLPVYNLWSRFVRPFARYRRHIDPVSRAAFVDERAAILSLNSARRWDLSFNWSHGRLSKAQILEADRFFAAAQDVPFRALVVHHPFYVPEELPGFKRIGRADAMLEVLARRRVHAVFSGHLHKRDVVARTMDIEAEDGVSQRTVQLLQVGSATSERQRDGTGGNGFIVVDVEDGGIFVTPWGSAEDGFVEGERVRVE